MHKINKTYGWNTFMVNIVRQFNEINTYLTETQSELFKKNDLESFYEYLTKTQVIRTWKVEKKITQLEKETDLQLKKWTQSRRNHPSSNKQIQIQDRTQIIHRAKNFKLATKILTITAIALACLAIISTILIFASPITFLITSLIIKPLFVITFISIQLLKLFSERVRRHKRVISNQNFQDFIHRYLIQRLDFKPNRLDLLDANVHRIFSYWKKEAKSLLSHALNHKYLGE